MSRVKLPLPLRRYTGGQSTVEVNESTVARCIESLEQRYPELRERLEDDEGDVSAAVNLYVNGQDVRHLAGLNTPVSDADEITIVVAIAGGMARMEGREGRGTVLHSFPSFLSLLSAWTPACRENVVVSASIFYVTESAYGRRACISGAWHLLEGEER